MFTVSVPVCPLGCLLSMSHGIYRSLYLYLYAGTRAFRHVMSYSKVLYYIVPSLENSLKEKKKSQGSVEHMTVRSWWFTRACFVCFVCVEYVNR